MNWVFMGLNGFLHNCLQAFEVKIRVVEYDIGMWWWGMRLGFYAWVIVVWVNPDRCVQMKSHRWNQILVLAFTTASNVALQAVWKDNNITGWFYLTCPTSCYLLNYWVMLVECHPENDLRKIGHWVSFHAVNSNFNMCSVKEPKIVREDI